MPNPYLNPYDPDANKWGAGIGTVLGGAFGGPIGGALGGWLGGKIGGGGSKPLDVNQDDLTPAPFANGVGGYTLPAAPASNPSTPPAWNFGTGSGRDASDDGSGFWNNGGLYEGMGGSSFAAGNPYAPNRPTYFGMKTKLGMLTDNQWGGDDPSGLLNFSPTPTPAASAAPNPFLSGPAASDYSHLFQNPNPKPKSNPFTFF